MARRLEYLQEEVRALREILMAKTGRPRITFTDDQRRRLALKGKILTPEGRRSCCQIVRVVVKFTLCCGIADTRSRQA
jgi:hypothetical protein